MSWSVIFDNEFSCNDLLFPPSPLCILMFFQKYIHSAEVKFIWPKLCIFLIQSKVRVSGSLWIELQTYLATTRSVPVCVRVRVCEYIIRLQYMIEKNWDNCVKTRKAIWRRSSAWDTLVTATFSEGTQYVLFKFCSYIDLIHWNVSSLGMEQS